MSGKIELIRIESDNDHQTETSTVNLASEDSGDSETFIYDSIVERKDVQATPRSLLLAGPKAMYHNSNRTQPRTRKGHQRSLSFAETLEPLTLTWNNINVFGEICATGFCGRSYKTGETRQILNNISGIAYPGRLLAILGPSGCGKTTLLNILTNRNLGELIIEGNVKTNGQCLGQGIKAVSAYVQENDVFIGNLKVKEHLWFHAMMKMDAHFSNDDIEARIEELLIELGLKKCAETYIGIPGTIKGISGGEMKRLSFASELLINPPVMFLDEPTSGLDAFMAENIVHTLKKMTRKNKTILFTIHQPSSDTYAMFDDILVLSEGNTVYMGSTKGSATFFKTCGLPCPVNYNPADHYVHCVSSEDANPDERYSIQTLVAKYHKTDEYKKIQKGILETNQNLDHSLLDETSMITAAKYKVGWLRQLRILLWRHWLSLARDSNLFVVRVGQITFLSIMIGLIYFQQPFDTAKGQMNLNGANFLLLTMMTFQIFFTVLNAFPSELPIFFREHSAGLYRVDAYFLSRNLTDFLLFLLLPTIVTTCVYGLIYTVHTVENFFVLYATAILVCKCSVSIGYFLSTVTMNLNLALAISPPLLIFLMMMSGYVVNVETIAVPIRYFQYISWFRYSYEILSLNQWIDVHNVSCVLSNTSRSPCYKDGADMLRYLKFNPSRTQYAIDFLVIILMIVIYRIVALVCLYLRCRETKRVVSDKEEE